MTVSYSSEVATTTAVGIFWKLLLRWKGSIYKLIWREVIVFVGLYYLIKVIYVYALEGEDKTFFEEIVKYCRSYSTSIPLSFVLGFYVNLVMDRWWQQYKCIPWPDTLGLLVSTLIHGLDERGRMMRRTIMRYVNLSYVMALSIISPRVRSKYPTMVHFVDAGFIENNEKEIIENLAERVPHSLYWMPLAWASSIIIRARKEGLIDDDFAVKTMLDTIIKFRGGLASLMGFHSICIPLVYTQVVTLAVYSFFAGSLLSSQHLDTDNEQRDLVIPWFTLLQYLFYVGWLKVAETLVNPFGTDDDDFELNILIERNFQVAYLIVDEMHEKYPELIQDKYWDTVMPTSGEIPYSAGTDIFRKSPTGSTSQVDGLKSLFFTRAASPLMRRVASKFRRLDKSDSPSPLINDSTKVFVEEGDVGTTPPLPKRIREIFAERYERSNIEQGTSAMGTSEQREFIPTNTISEETETIASRNKETIPYADE